MHYYVIKPKRRRINRNIIRGIFEMDENAVIVEDMSDADICVQESYLYTDRLVAHVS